MPLSHASAWTIPNECVFFFIHTSLHPVSSSNRIISILPSWRSLKRSCTSAGGSRWKYSHHVVTGNNTKNKSVSEQLTLLRYAFIHLVKVCICTAFLSSEKQNEKTRDLTSFSLRINRINASTLYLETCFLSINPICPAWLFRSSFPSNDPFHSSESSTRKTVLRTKFKMKKWKSQAVRRAWTRHRKKKKLSDSTCLLECYWQAVGRKRWV